MCRIQPNHDAGRIMALASVIVNLQVLRSLTRNAHGRRLVAVVVAVAAAAMVAAAMAAAAAAVVVEAGSIAQWALARAKMKVHGAEPRKQVQAGQSSI